METLVIDSDSLGLMPTVPCCQCGVPMQANALGMCDGCLKTRVDFSNNISENNSIQFCRKCDRYLQPPSTWIQCALESRELLSLCLKRLKGLSNLHLIDASFLWTEPHSKQLKVKLVVQGDVSGVIVQQSFVVSYSILSQICSDCQRMEAKDFWKSVVQVRQKTTHRKTFYYLEQIILKHNAHAACTSVKPESGGIDFFFAREQDARKFVEFVHKFVPCRHQSSKKLKSHDVHNTVYNYKLSHSVEIVPICRDNILCLSKQLCQSLGNLGRFSICLRVTNIIVLIDPFSLQTAEISSNVYWRDPFKPIADPSQYSEFVVMEVEAIRNFTHNPGCGQISQHHTLADVYVSRPHEIGVKQIHTRTHLGKVLSPGDTVLGFDFENNNITHPMMDSISEDRVPDVILVRKVVSTKKSRKWKLKHIAKNNEDDAEFNEFLEDVEEDATVRANISVYKQQSKGEESSGDMEEISLQEMIDDLNIDEFNPSAQTSMDIE